MKKVTDEAIAEAFRRTRNYAEVGRIVGLAKQTVSTRVMRLRLEGVDLPPSRPAGYTLTSERAKEIRRLRDVKTA